MLPITRAAAIFLQCVVAVPAVAHPGHLAAAGGHDHWIAGAAIGAAVAVAAWAALRGWRKRAEAPCDAEAEAGADHEDDETGERA